MLLVFDEEISRWDSKISKPSSLVNYAFQRMKTFPLDTMFKNMVDYRKLNTA